MFKYKTLLSFCMMFSLLGCSEEEKAQKEIIRPIQWVKVRSSDFMQQRSISGVIQAAEKTELSFEVGGKVSKVNVTLGDVFKKGDILAELDRSSYNLNSRAANAQLKQADSALIETQNEFERQFNLFKKGWVSQSAYDNAKAALDAAKSAVDVATVQLDLTKKDLGDTSLTAPYDGTITSRYIEPSQQVSSGQICFEIEGNKGLEVAVMVPETILDNLDKETAYDVSFPAVPDLKVSAKITEISTQAEAANAFPVILSFQNTNKQLRAGMSAEVDLTFKGNGIITGYTGVTIKVPPTALLSGEDNNTYVFVYNPSEGIVNKRKVLPENIINNEALITQGLKPGEIIATAGVEYLHDTQKVRLMDTGPNTFN